MITRILLIKPNTTTNHERFLETLERLQHLREEWPGISDLLIGTTTSSEYPYAAVLRFVRPHVSIPVVQTPEYQAVIQTIQDLGGTVLSLDIEHQSTAGERRASTVPAYGRFQPAVEEQLRSLIYQWFQGNGQPLTHQTPVWSLSQPNDLGLSLLEFERALQQHFGAKAADLIMNSYWHKNATFGDVLIVLERHLSETQRENQSQGQA